MSDLRALEIGETVYVLDRAEVVELKVQYKYSGGEYLVGLPSWLCHRTESRKDIFPLEETPRLIRALEQIKKEASVSLDKFKENPHDNITT